MIGFRIVVLVEPQPSWVRVLACFNVHATISAGWPRGRAEPGLAGCGHLWLLSRGAVPLAVVCCTTAAESVARWPPLLLPHVAMLGCCCATQSHVLAPCLCSSCHAVCTLPPSYGLPCPSFLLPRCTPRVSHCRRDVGDDPGSQWRLDVPLPRLSR
jgi:hypothetical protein